MKRFIQFILFTTITIMPLIVLAQDLEPNSTAIPSWLSLLASMLPVILPLTLVPFIGWGVKQIKSVAESKIKNETLSRITGTLTTVVFGAVSSLAQEMADEFKKASADNKLTAEEKSKLKELAINRVKDILSGENWALLVDAFGDEDSATKVVEDQIEAAVRSGK